MSVLVTFVQGMAARVHFGCFMFDKKSGNFVNLSSLFTREFKLQRGNYIVQIDLCQKIMVNGVYSKFVIQSKDETLDLLLE